MARISLEIELKSLEDGSEHPIEFFRAEIKEFFETFGWKVLSTSHDGNYEEDEEEDDEG